MKVMVLLRAVPGAGKSFYIAELREEMFASLDYSGGEVEICSADHYHMIEDGVYFFKPENIGAAHAACFKKAEAFVQAEKPGLVIIDNTNIRSYELAPYIMLANAYGWKHEIHELRVDPAVAFARQTHGVPGVQHARMADAMISEDLPAFWNRKVLYRV